jgi:iron complex outermembrane receptor protein
VNLHLHRPVRDNTVGVALGVRVQQDAVPAQTREPWGYADHSVATRRSAATRTACKSSFYKRKPIMGVVEFKPSDKLHMVLDAYHSDFQELQTIQRMEYGTHWSGATLDQSGPGGKRPRPVGHVRERAVHGHRELQQRSRCTVDSIGLNTQYAFNDDWSMEADLSWSKVDRDDLRLESTEVRLGRQRPEPAALVETISFTTDATASRISRRRTTTATTTRCSSPIRARGVVVRGVQDSWCA